MPEETTPDTHIGLRGKIMSAINETSAENGSDTPDFILAQYLVDCLRAFDGAVKRRDNWYGLALRGGTVHTQVPINTSEL